MSHLRRHKISIIGAGNVGATAAHWLASKHLGDVVLLDINEGVAQGKALDLAQSGPVEGFDCAIHGTADYFDTKDSDVVIITAGIPRKPGMSRDDLLKTNANIVSQVTEQVTKHSPNAILIVVSNPLDAMAYVAKKVSGFPRERVIGMAGVLDTARYKTFLARELNVSVEDIQGFVFGGHGDTMVPLPRYTTVAGLPLSSLLSEDKIEAIIDRTRKGGAEIVNYLKSGSAFFAPSASAVEMTESILRDKKRLLPCSLWLEGEFGFENLYLGVLAKLGSQGLEEIIKVELTDKEKEALKHSAEAVQGLMKTIDNL